MKFSIVIPVYNEAENLRPLAEALARVLNSLTSDWECFFVDDGSLDQSYAELRELAHSEVRFKAVRLQRNYGQTAAIAAGVERARGEIIILMDADLQNDPEDIPRMLQKLDEGFDIVSGWRRKRHDEFFKRLLPSWLANALISRVTGVKLHDYGCTLKAYRAEFLKGIELYGEMHRFLPAYGASLGARIAEIEVRHHPRRHGVSKYGLGRTLLVLVDLLVFRFITQYATKPMHFFGRAATWMAGLGTATALLAVYFKVTGEKDFVETPLPLLTAFFLLVGLQFLLMGLLAEVITRTWHESQGKQIYRIRETMNI
ncbi:glycosyltransferase family 2 protein [Candidatus Parcubacteria bacterium]|nr:glycosyltransferase family 2 protein [Candidatus Parcubacteria bacterium]